MNKLLIVCKLKCWKLSIYKLSRIKFNFSFKDVSRCFRNRKVRCTYHDFFLSNHKYIWTVLCKILIGQDIDYNNNLNLFNARIFFAKLSFSADFNLFILLFWISILDLINYLSSKIVYDRIKCDWGAAALTTVNILGFFWSITFSINSYK